MSGLTPSINRSIPSIVWPETAEVVGRKLGKKAQAPWELNLSLCFPESEMPWWRLGPWLRFQGLVNSVFVFFTRVNVLSSLLRRLHRSRVQTALHRLLLFFCPSGPMQLTDPDLKASSLTSDFFPFNCTQSPSFLDGVWLLRGFTLVFFLLKLSAC